MIAPAFENVCFAGLGASATSLALSLGRAPSGRPRLTGWDPQSALVDAALGLGAIDRATAFPQDVLPEADLVVLSLDGEDLARFGRAYAPMMRPDAALIDLSPVKAAVFDALAGHLPPALRHTPCLPVLRVEGPARADLFEGQPVALGRPRQGLDPRIEALWRSAGASPRWVAGDQLDLILAATRGAPLATSAALITALDELSEVFAVEGLGGVGIAAAAQAMGAEPAATLAHLKANRNALMSALPRVISVLQDLEGWIELKRWDRVEALLERAHARRGDFVDVKEGA